MKGKPRNHIHPSTRIPDHGGLIGQHHSGVIRIPDAHHSIRSTWQRNVGKCAAVRLLPGCFLPADIWQRSRQWQRYRYLCIAAALKYPGRFLTEGAAASIHGMWLPDPSDQIIAGSPTGRSLTFVRTIDPQVQVLQRCRSVPVGEVILAEGLAVTSLAWTATSIAAAVPAESDSPTAIMALESALHLGTTKEDLIRCSVDCGGNRRGPALEKWIDLAGIRSESAAESFMRAILLDMGLTEHLQQVVIEDAHGNFVGRVDFLLPHLNVIFEVDGESKYEGLDTESRSAATKERHR